MEYGSFEQVGNTLFSFRFTQFARQTELVFEAAKLINVGADKFWNEEEFTLVAAGDFGPVSRVRSAKTNATSISGTCTSWGDSTKLQKESVLVLLDKGNDYLQSIQRCI